MRATVWFFDLDDTLHDASTASMPHLRASFGEYIEQHLRMTRDESDALRRRYWLRYGATLLGLVRHHGVRAAHFLHETHRLPGLEARVRGHRADLRALARLPGRRFILTNAPAAYAERVLVALGIGHCFEAVLSIERMHMFGQLRPKPDARMLRRMAARLRVPPAACVLVEDTLAHQKSAHRIGMGTVWMQRWVRPKPGGGRPAGHAAAPQPPGLAPAGPPGAGRPGYVDRRIRRLADLLRR
ncbi:MAG: HAD-IA family hydrolase [Burkholderiales bacterium]|nr:HAD-IA family hydrolase [Burkholderiales bacterium]